MSVSRPRNRIVYFRLSEDEFRQLHQVCQVVGARSISDLARSAIQTMLDETPYGDHGPICAKLDVLQNLITEINDKIGGLILSPKKADVYAPDRGAEIGVPLSSIESDI